MAQQSTDLAKTLTCTFGRQSYNFPPLASGAEAAILALLFGFQGVASTLKYCIYIITCSDIVIYSNEHIYELLLASKARITLEMNATDIPQLI